MKIVSCNCFRNSKKKHRIVEIYQNKDGSYKINDYYSGFGGDGTGTTYRNVKYCPICKKEIKVK